MSVLLNWRKDGVMEVYDAKTWNLCTVFPWYAEYWLRHEFILTPEQLDVVNVWFNAKGAFIPGR